MLLLKITINMLLTNELDFVKTSGLQNFTVKNAEIMRKL